MVHSIGFIAGKNHNGMLRGRIFIMSLFYTLSFIMTGCEKEDDGAFVSLTVDGKSYTSSTKSVNDKNQAYCDLKNGFYLMYNDVLTSSDGRKLGVYVRIADSEGYSIGRRYVMPASAGINGNMAHVTLYSETGNRRLHYYVTEGWFELDKLEIDKRSAICVVCGNFTFTAMEEHTGDIIHVTDGVFRDVRLGV